MSYPRPRNLINEGEMKSPQGGENKGKKTISGRRNEDTHLQYHGGYKIQRDSIPKIGTKTSKRKTVGKCQISGRKVAENLTDGVSQLSPGQSYLKSPCSIPRGRM